MTDQAKLGRRISARQFLAEFYSKAKALSAELIPIWNMKSTDRPYTTFMSTRLFPATARGLNVDFTPQFPYKERDGRSRYLDAAFVPPNGGMDVQEVLVAIEIENKEQTRMALKLLLTGCAER